MKELGLMVWWPFAASPAGGGRKPPRGASVKSRGAERRGKGVLSARQVWITKASESDTTVEVSKAYR